MTYRMLLAEAVGALEDAGVPDASLDAWYLLEYAFGLTREWFLMEGNGKIPREKERETARFRALIEKRKQRVPLQYLTGMQEFMGLPFLVNEHVLIPRQDTENLVEAALALAKPQWTILDMCTGSGCILISMLALGKDLRGCGADISREALEVARENGRRNGVSAQWVKSDLFSAITGRYHMIVSNPPYIPTAEISRLMPEVREHEPLRALDGSGDGMAFYRRLISEAETFLFPGGWLALEIGFDQGRAVYEMMEQRGYRDVEIRKDYGGNDRIVVGHL